MIRKIVKLFIVCGICLGSRSGFCYMINDAVYTNQYGLLKDVYDNGDRIGKAEFELFGIDYQQSGRWLTLNIYTNFPEQGTWVGGLHLLPADLAIDVDGIANGYEYGIALRDHDNVSKGSLYEIDNWHYSSLPGGYHYHAGLPVLIEDGTWLSDGNFTVSNLDTNHHDLFPDYMITTTLDLNKLAIDSQQSLNIFYGEADCANDYLYGSVNIVPEPMSLSLLGLGLLGLFGLKKRKV